MGVLNNCNLDQQGCCTVTSRLFCLWIQIPEIARYQNIIFWLWTIFWFSSNVVGGGLVAENCIRMPLLSNENRLVLFHEHIFGYFTILFYNFCLQTTLHIPLGIVPCVDHHVFGEVTLMPEALSTFRTRERFLPCMNPEMLGECVFS